MDNSFLAYIQQLELLAFFSGYPLIYAIILFIADNRRLKNNVFKRATQLLPLAYALVGTLFLGFELKKLYPDYSIENIRHTVQQPYLIVWGLLSMLFWIPAFSRKRILSLLHGLVFFLVIVKDMFLQMTTPSTDNNIVKNDMKVYSSSIILNLAAIIIIGVISFFLARYKKPLAQ